MGSFYSSFFAFQSFILFKFVTVISELQLPSSKSMQIFASLGARIAIQQVSNVFDHMIQAEFVSIDRYNTMPNNPKDRGKKTRRKKNYTSGWMEDGCI